jgi:Xaa-Pro dipeptidase
MEDEFHLHLGPDGEDWRVPVDELEARQRLFAEELAEHGHSAALIQHPIDLYYFTGGRQDSTFFIPAKGAPGSIEAGDDGPTAFVRRSLRRAMYEAGEDNAPHQVVEFGRLSQFTDTLKSMGVTEQPSLQYGEIPASFSKRFEQAIAGLEGECGDVTSLVHSMREVKSEWELEQMNVGAQVQRRMFKAIEAIGGEGMSELDLVAAAEAISRSEGFGGNVQMRRYPLQCDRGVIVAGRAGGVPSFFDSAIGGEGPHPLSGMGAGFNKIKRNEPVLVDLVHVHRGYVVDTTRMFVSGRLSSLWEERLDDMLAVKNTVIDVLDQGQNCSQAWLEGLEVATELGHAEHLMGMAPDQSKFLGHSVGLQLDESPVIARGFDRPLPIRGVMAIEPKVVHNDGSIGTEDTWVRTEEGLAPITADADLPWLIEWSS